MRLQAPRQVPFADFDGVYIKQGAAVHAWVWSRSLITAAQGKLLGELERLSVMPESLWGRVPRNGSVVQQCALGAEALRFENGNLKQAQWWPDVPDTKVLQAFDPGLGLGVNTQTSRARIAAGLRWAGGVKSLSASVDQTGFNAWATWIQKPYAWVALGWLALGLVVGYAGWIKATEQQIALARTATQKELDSLLLVSGRQAKAHGSSLQPADDLFAQDVKQATDGVRLDTLLGRLAGPLSARGLLIRELVVERSDIKIALVSGFGGDVDLDAATTALELAGDWDRVELLDFANPTQARFGLRERRAKPTKGVK